MLLPALCLMLLLPPAALQAAVGNAVSGGRVEQMLYVGGGEEIAVLVDETTAIQMHIFDAQTRIHTRSYEIPKKFAGKFYVVSTQAGLTIASEAPDTGLFQFHKYHGGLLQELELGAYRVPEHFSITKKLYWRDALALPALDDQGNKILLYLRDDHLTVFPFEETVGQDYQDNLFSLYATRNGIGYVFYASKDLDAVGIGMFPVDGELVFLEGDTDALRPQFDALYASVYGEMLPPADLPPGLMMISIWALWSC